VSREIITDSLASLDALAVTIDRLDGEVREHAKADPRVKVLTALPGIGQFTALVMLAEIGDITRFGSARKLASWAGLTPTVRGSAHTVRHGHISKQGSAWLRWVLNQAAQTAKRSPEFAGTYAAIASRRGKKIATIAIARKLLTRAYHLLADDQAARAPSSATPATTADRAAIAHPQTARSPSPGHARSSGMSSVPGRARSSDRAARSPNTRSWRPPHLSATPNGCLRDHSANPRGDTQPLITSATTFLAPDDLSPLAGVQLVRPRRCAAPGAEQDPSRTAT
jgi:hypothetical protein